MDKKYVNYIIFFKNYIILIWAKKTQFKKVFTYLKLQTLKKIKNNQPEPAELGKSEPHLLVQVIKYIPKAIIKKAILKKLTGNITAMSVATGETIVEKTIPFDTFIQIIDGAAEVIIDKKVHQLKLGNGIIIPAHTKHSIIANEQFKMISTVIKCGYEL